MEKVNNTIRVYAQILCFLGIWAIVLLVSRTYSTLDFWSALKQVPTAISIYVLVGVVFINWAWRWRFLQGWLIKVPDLRGTWRGELKSDWINPDTGQRIAPIAVMLVVRQNFSSISIVVMTQESSSYSTAAEINVMPGTDQHYLSYTYTNRPKATIRNRSEIHDGAAILKIVRTPLSLEGEYWTSRKTRGDIEVAHQSRKRAEQFA